MELDGLEILSFRDRIRANHWFYSLKIDKERYGIGRDELLKKLVESNIQTRPIWGLIHQQKPYSACQSYKIEKALYYYDRILNLPCSSNLTEKEVYQVIEKIKEFKK